MSDGRRTLQAKYTKQLREIRKLVEDFAKNDAGGVEIETTVRNAWKAFERIYRKTGGDPKDLT